MKSNNVFVKVEEYDNILDMIDVFRKKLDEVKTTLNKIELLREEEQAELNTWRSNINEVELKVDEVNKSLFEPEE
ncbi:MAG: hypothetical protein AB7V77_03675 [Candidatus Woesearchaeota archaeon]